MGSWWRRSDFPPNQFIPSIQPAVDEPRPISPILHIWLNYLNQAALQCNNVSRKFIISARSSLCFSVQAPARSNSLFDICHSDQKTKESHSAVSLTLCIFLYWTGMAVDMEVYKCWMCSANKKTGWMKNQIHPNLGCVPSNPGKGRQSMILGDPWYAPILSPPTLAGMAVHKNPGILCLVELFARHALACLLHCSLFQ